MEIRYLPLSVNSALARFDYLLSPSAAGSDSRWVPRTDWSRWGFACNWWLMIGDDRCLAPIKRRVGLLAFDGCQAPIGVGFSPHRSGRLVLPAAFGAGSVFRPHHRSRCAYRWLPAGHRSAVREYRRSIRCIVAGSKGARHPLTKRVTIPPLSTHFLDSPSNVLLSLKSSGLRFPMDAWHRLEVGAGLLAIGVLVGAGSPLERLRTRRVSPVAINHLSPTRFPRLFGCDSDYLWVSCCG